MSKIIITRELGGTYRIRTPDGEYYSVTSRDFAQAYATRWQLENQERCEIEWREGRP